jgi:glycosidase
MGDKAGHRRLLGDTENDGLNLAFVFDMIFLLPWQRSAKFFRRVLEGLETHFPPPFQPTLVFGNHDMRRLLSRIGGDIPLARLLALFQLTARGVPTVYMGEEIGMTDVFIPRARAQDPVSRQWDRVPDRVRRLLPVNLNRDMNRTPMQWNGGDNAGFCPPDTTPWLPVNVENKHERNVEAQLADQGSLLHLYRTLLHLRRESPALNRGTLALLDGLPKTVLGYAREYEDQRVTVFLNFGKRPVAFDRGLSARALLAVGDSRVRGSRVELPPRGGIVAETAGARP